MHRYSFSTDSERSMPPGRLPISGLRICVVAVVPCGICHWPRQWSRAVFSCAPANEMRNASSLPMPTHV